MTTRHRRHPLERAALLGILALLPSALPAALPLSEFSDPHPSPGNGFGQSLVTLSTGNVVITAPYDDAGGTDAGAVYLFNGATGALISTVTGSTASDNVGPGPRRFFRRRGHFLPYASANEKLSRCPATCTVQ